MTKNYINRELSWLEFNRRVLDEARDAGIPLLERLRFLTITASNLDEFFMVRVGSLRALAMQGQTRPDPAGLTPAEQLTAMSERTDRIVFEQYTEFLHVLEPELAEAGIRRLLSHELNETQATALKRVFEEIASIYTPMAVTSSDEFPMLIGRSLNVCVQLAPSSDSEDGLNRFAIIPFGRLQQRLVTLPSDGGYTYVLLEDVIELFVQRFFPGEEVVACAPFRITRNADTSVREDLASDLLEQMQEVIDERRWGFCVRLELSLRSTSEMRAFLKQSLEMDDKFIFTLPGPLDLTAFTDICDLPGFSQLRYEDWPSNSVPRVEPTASMFDVIREQDLLLYHPFESFDPVANFIIEAADDPDVVAIKQTLYRTGRHSRIIDALIQASENGKNVTVIVELKARFDEERNITRARQLEQAGVQVIYGVKGLKTHSKICIVVRREPDGLLRYVHFGTGNYNEQTARFYTDASLLTCDEQLGAEAISFFNAITGYSSPQAFAGIEMAPIGLREKILELIYVETEQARGGQPARIVAKMNALVDPQIIDALYLASQAGVKIQLNVRGICCLKPGVPGLSENIHVVSIVDRLLEHSRIVYFYHDGDELVFISSADWMPRNLDRRVELLIPVRDPDCRTRLIEILETCLADTQKARVLQPSGSYKRLAATSPGPLVRSQAVLYDQASQRANQSRAAVRSTFQPHRAADED